MQKLNIVNIDKRERHPGTIENQRQKVASYK